MRKRGATSQPSTKSSVDEHTAAQAHLDGHAPVKVEDRKAAVEGLQAGDRLGVSIGKETYFPIKFNGFDVGPVSIETTVREGESGADAYLRVRGAAEAIFQAEYEVKVKDYFDRLRKTGERADRERS